MKTICRLLICFFISGLFVFPSFGQEKQFSPYDPYQVFDPVFFTHNGNRIRGADGAPGPKYWQNRADYVIHATLDEKDTLLKGEVEIHYTNNSPYSLHYLWLQLDQNLFKPDSRGAATTPVTGDRFDVKGYKKGGYRIASVKVHYKGKSYAIDPVITDTRMQLRLPFSVHPDGDKIRVNVQYSFSIPEYGADRMGRLYTKNGVIYQLAQWYPRMYVYDDVNGWNNLPYKGLGEFYLEYGDFDYYITVPSDMIVIGSGDLQNPDEVLTQSELQRLNKAKESDTAVTVISASEIGKPAARPRHSGTQTWHYKMKDTRDISWSASAAFIWDAARVNLPSGKKAIAMAAYPVESMGDSAYGRATEYLKKSIEFYSKNYYEYPWHSAAVVAGVALGMEYPGIIFCSYKIKRGSLWGDITHEIGHNWFPMLVGSNERRYMWQDEGLNTYINRKATKWFNNGEYYRAPTPRRMQFMAQMMKRLPEPLMTAPSSMGLRDYGQYYSKTALALNILRDEVIGSERFDYAFKTYINRWAFRHPQPDDFFRSMNDAAGDDLNWFWKEWFFKTWTLDQAIKKVTYVDRDTARGALITLENLGQMALPVTIKVVEQNGDSSLVNLPVDIWQRGGEWTFQYDSHSSLTKVILDPEAVLPDTDRDNNSWASEK